MQLLFIRHARARVQQVSLTGKNLCWALLGLLVLLMGLNLLAAWLLSALGFNTGEGKVAVEARYEQKLNELGTQIAELNLRLKRLDAVRQQMLETSPQPPSLPDARPNVAPNAVPVKPLPPATRSQGGQGGPMLSAVYTLPESASFQVRMDQLSFTLRDLQAQTQLLTDRLQTLKVWQATAPTGYPLPYIVPVTSLPGMRMDPFTGLPSWHAGTDYGAYAGMPILATGDGYVTRAAWDKDFGYVVELTHPGVNMMTRYAHAEALYVQLGQRVSRGEVIARVGSTGRSTAPHLHYEMQPLH